MNDDFLHQLRVQPPSEFAARLRGRLNLLPSAARPATKVRVLRAWPALVLVGGAVLAAGSPAVRGLVAYLWRTVFTADSDALPVNAAAARPVVRPVDVTGQSAGQSTNSSLAETSQLHADTASAVNSIPNMTCTPSFPRERELPPSQWNNCVGTYTYQNGNVYSGEFRHGDRYGFGVLEITFIGRSTDNVIGWDEPAIYVGSFRNGFRNGYGLLIAKSGAAYAGLFKDNFAQSELTHVECQGDISAAWTNCIGTYRFQNGNVYRGEFANGLPDGIGTLEVNAIGSSDSTQVRLPAPGVYVGEFRDGRLNGRGAVVMSGAGYLGTFSDNTFKLDRAHGTEPPPDEHAARP